jgi:hypothetical protein
MLDIHVAEFFVQAKQEDMRRARDRQRLVTEAGATARCLHPRQTIAMALLRLARAIDESAGGPIAAPAGK